MCCAASHLIIGKNWPPGRRTGPRAVGGSDESYQLALAACSLCSPRVCAAPGIRWGIRPFRRLPRLSAPHGRAESQLQRHGWRFPNVPHVDGKTWACYDTGRDDARYARVSRQHPAASAWPRGGGGPGRSTDGTGMWPQLDIAQRPVWLWDSDDIVTMDTDHIGWYLVHVSPRHVCACRVPGVHKRSRKNDDPTAHKGDGQQGASPSFCPLRRTRRAGDSRGAKMTGPKKEAASAPSNTARALNSSHQAKGPDESTLCSLLCSAPHRHPGRNGNAVAAAHLHDSAHRRAACTGRGEPSHRASPAPSMAPCDLAQ